MVDNNPREGLHEGRVPLVDAEHDAVDDLITKHDGCQATLTRRDPGNTGPLVVHIHLVDGEQTYIVEENGKVRKPTKKEQSW